MQTKSFTSGKRHLQPENLLFDCFCLDASDLLFRHGRRISLEPIQARVLRALLNSSGRVVSKEELVDFAWRGRDVSDESIARAVYQLRNSLGGPRERYIQAVSGRGYRFTCPVQRHGPLLVSSLAASAPPQDLDLTEQARLTTLFKVSHALANDHDAMLGYWDLNLRCLSANPAYEIWFGRSPLKMRGITLAELLGPLFAMNLPYIEGVKRGQTQHFKRSILLPGGQTRQSLASYFPDLRDGRVQGFSVLVLDAQRFES